MERPIEHDFGALNTTLRAKETRLLNREIMHRLVEAKDYDEALNILEQTAYRDGIEKARETRDYQSLVTQQLKDSYYWMMRECPDKRLALALTLKYVYHNLKVLFKETMEGTKHSELLIDITPIPIYELRQAIEKGGHINFPNEFNQMIQQLKTFFTSSKQYHQLDIYIDRAYLHHLKSLTEQFVDSDTVNYFEQLIDKNLLLIFFRAIRFNYTSRELAGILTDDGQISVKDYIELAEQGEAKAIQYFSTHSDYAHLFDDAIDEMGQLNLAILEKNIDNSLMRYLSQAKYQTFGSLPLVYYIERKEMECHHLRLVLAGHLNNIDSIIIKKRMRQPYAI